MTVYILPLFYFLILIRFAARKLKIVDEGLRETFPLFCLISHASFNKINAVSFTETHYIVPGLLSVYSY